MTRAVRARAPSALTAIGSFSVAIAVLSVAITASIVLLMPDPPAVRMTAAEAVAALRGNIGPLERSERPPPDGPRAALLEQVLANEMHRPASAVRVVWLEKTIVTLPAGSTIVLMRGRGQPGGLPPKMLWPEGKPPPGTTIVTRRAVQPVRLVPQSSVARLLGGVLLTLPQPAFAASVRQSDGRWMTVAPRVPVFAGWRLKLLAALAASLAVLAPLVWLFARRMTRPFRALATAIDHGRDPPQAQGPRELQDAARAILQLRARLAKDAEEQMRMLIAVAHDLRTPLTSLRLRIEGIAEPQRTRIIADADRMQAMIGDVLAFARAADAPREPTAIRAVIADIVADTPAVSLRDGEELTLCIVAPAFRRAIENLVRNAIDYAGGGRIELDRDADAAFIRVIDAGPGIDAADRTRLLRPFERGDASRNRDTGGVGLGLSIVQSFADLHDGMLSLEAAPGGGTMVTLCLPR